MAPATIEALKMRKKKKVEITVDTIMSFVESGSSKKADMQEDLDPEMQINPIAVARIKAEKEKIMKKKMKEKKAKQEAAKKKAAAKAAERAARAAAKGVRSSQMKRAASKDEISYFTASTDRSTGAGAFAKLGVSVEEKAESRNSSRAPSRDAINVADIDMELEKMHGGKRRVREANPNEDRMLREAKAAALEAEKQSRKSGGLFSKAAAVGGIFRPRRSSSSVDSIQEDSTPPPVLQQMSRYDSRPSFV